MNFFKKCAAVLLSGATVISLTVPAMVFATDAANESETESETEESKDYTSGDWTYVFNTKNDEYYNKDEYKEDSIRITGYTGKDKKLKIPSELDGHEVTALAHYSFVDGNYTEITLPKTLIIMGECCFYGCDKLNEVKVEKGNDSFVDKDGILYSANGSIIYFYPSTREESSFDIPDGVVEVWAGCFINSTISKFKLPSTLTFIDNWSFAYCERISTIRIPAKVKDVGKYAFAYCSNLIGVTFSGESLENIDAGAFCQCSSLSDIIIPEGVSTIGEAAFAGTALKSVRIPSSVEQIGYYAFGYSYSEDGGFKAIHDFIVEGPSGGAGEDYASMEDEENDYKNNFSFLSDDKAKENEESEDNEPSKSFKDVLPIILICVAVVAVIAIIIILIISKKKNTKNTKKSKK